jgi:hypothetical protein
MTWGLKNIGAAHVARAAAIIDTSLTKPDRVRLESITGSPYARS